MINFGWSNPHHYLKPMFASYHVRKKTIMGAAIFNIQVNCDCALFDVNWKVIIYISMNNHVKFKNEWTRKFYIVDSI